MNELKNTLWVWAWEQGINNDGKRKARDGGLKIKSASARPDKKQVFDFMSTTISWVITAVKMLTCF